MRNRRAFVRVLACGLAALCVLVVPVLADEIIGVLSKVDVEGKKVTVIEKDTDKETEITITDETEQVARKKAGKVDLEKLSKAVAKAKEAGKKGIGVTVTHEKGVASKIVMKGFGKGKPAETKPAIKGDND